MCLTCVTVITIFQDGRTCLAFNAVSRYIMAGGADGVVNVYDLKTQKLKKSYKVCLDLLFLNHIVRFLI